MKFISILLCVFGITSFAYRDAVAAPLILNCELRDGVQHSEVTLTIDVVNQIVNGWQAHISDDFIEWDAPTSEGEKAHMLVNRLNGSLKIQGINTNVQGSCMAPSLANRSNVLPDGITLNSGRWPDGRVRVIINMKGPISDDGFLQALQHEIDLKQNPRVVVMINSPGGDWDASLALGRYLRKIEASVSVMGDC